LQPQKRDDADHHPGEREQAPEDALSELSGDRAQITALMTKLTTMAVPKKVAVAVMLAGEAIALPLNPLPEVHPPAALAPKPIRTPATTRIGAMRMAASPLKVAVSQP